MKRPDYQNLNDDLEEITDARNAAVRAWGKQILADADALLLSQVRDGGDWDLLPDDEIAIAPAPEPEIEGEEILPSGEEEQEEVPVGEEIVPPSTPVVQDKAVQSSTVVQVPKTPKPRKLKDESTS